MADGCYIIDVDGRRHRYLAGQEPSPEGRKAIEEVIRAALRKTEEDNPAPQE